MSRRVSRIQGKRDRNGNDSRKMLDKGHRTIIQVGQVEFYSTMFLCSVVWILSLKRSKHSNRAVNCIKYSNRTVKNVLLTIPPGTHIDGL